MFILINMAMSIGELNFCFCMWSPRKSFVLRAYNYQIRYERTFAPGAKSLL